MTEKVSLFAIQHCCLIGMLFVAMVVAAAMALMWYEYRSYLHEHLQKRFSVMEFVIREQLHVQLLILFFFLIGGELLLYSLM